MDISRDDEIDRQIMRHDVDPHDVDIVIITHLDTDHYGGMYHFPNSKILVPSADYQEAKGLPGKMKGYLPQWWESWFNPTEMMFQNRPFGPFSQSLPATNNDSVIIAPPTYTWPCFRNSRCWY